MSHRLQVLIPETLDLSIQKASQRCRISKGEWVRRAIERALDEGRTSANPLAKLSSLDAPTGDIEQMIGEIRSGRE